MGVSAAFEDKQLWFHQIIVSCTSVCKLLLFHYATAYVLLFCKNGKLLLHSRVNLWFYLQSMLVSILLCDMLGGIINYRKKTWLQIGN